MNVIIGMLTFINYIIFKINYLAWLQGGVIPFMRA